MIYFIKHTQCQWKLWLDGRNSKVRGKMKASSENTDDYYCYWLIIPTYLLHVFPLKCIVCNYSKNNMSLAQHNTPSIMLNYNPWNHMTLLVCKSLSHPSSLVLFYAFITHDNIHRCLLHTSPSLSKELWIKLNSEFY